MCLVKSILSIQGSFEICVHDDGSTDETFLLLSSIVDPRLRLARNSNGGRGQALESVIRMAKGEYVMIFDDDDLLYSEGLKTVLEDCASPLCETCAGWIYHLEDDNGLQIGDDFPQTRSNFVALRFDYGVTGDKKEVVRRSTILGVLQVPGTPRRIPTSLYWSRIAIAHDVLCKNSIIGRKTYLEGGMSDRIKGLKSSNPYPMLLLECAQLHAYVVRRYRSPRFFARSLAAFFVYGIRCLFQRVGRGAHV